VEQVSGAAKRTFFTASSAMTTWTFPGSKTVCSGLQAASDGEATDKQANKTNDVIFFTSP